MLKRQKINIKKLFSESFLIIFSVLFALLINEWRTAYKEKQRTISMLNNIRQELMANQQFVDQLISYHESVVQKIQQVRKQGDLKATFYSEDGFG
ncbi:MAG: hypothetical protein AAGD05_17810, partial [Bacteroidota bacterium]